MCSAPRTASKAPPRAVSQTELETACHLVENVFAQWKHAGVSSSVAGFDALHRVTDLLSAMTAQGHPSATSADTRLLLRQVETLLEGGASARTPPQPELESPLPAPKVPAITAPSPPLVTAPGPLPAASAIPAVAPPAANHTPLVPHDAAAVPSAPVSMETIRVSTHKLDELLLRTEELLATKQATGHVALRLAGLGERFRTWRRTWTRLGPALRALERPSGSDPVQAKAILDFVDWNRQFVEALAAEVGAVAQLARQNHRGASLAIDTLIEEMKRVLMRPFTVAMEGLPRVVRDLARDLGKEATLTVRGVPTLRWTGGSWRR